MELRTLGYFVAIAEAGTVVAAAEQVRVTQPALSRQLRQLERELGVELFERRRGRLVLSGSGRALLPLAREVLARADDLRTAAGLRAHGRLEVVAIAAPTTTLTDLVSPFLATVEHDDPTPRVMASDGMPPDEAIARGADVVISADPLPSTLRSRPLAQLPVLAYVRADHPWAGRSQVSLAEIVDSAVIALPETFSARRAVDAAVARAGLTPVSPVAEATNGTVAQALAAAGRGAALVSDDPRFDLIGLPVSDSSGGDVVIDLYAGWPARHPGAPHLADLVVRLKAWIDQQHTRS